MKGLGFFIWQLDTIMDFYNPVQLANLLKQARVEWVSWKLAEGIYPWNQIGGNDKILIEYMQALEAVGVASGGWSYNYPEKPGAQSGLIAERIAKFSNNLTHFDHWMVDIEREWKKPNLGGAIDSLLYIDINKNFPVGFCSYRYPELHAPLNFSRFLKNETIKFNAPQVYWLGAHDVTAQLDRSFAQYRKLTDKPFIPIGAAWGQNVGEGKDAYYWQVTVDDLKAFVSHCRLNGWNTYGFWSLDWIVKKQKLDWLEAISGGSVLPPAPPPATQVQVISVVANIRSGKDYSPVVAQSKQGTILAIDGKDGEWYKLAGPLYIHETVVKEL